MSNLLIINTPQVDYLYDEDGSIVPEAQRVYGDIVNHLLHDTSFMSKVDIVCIPLDFFPITNEHYNDIPDGGHMRCLSFTQGASILPDIADNIHYMQECAIKKLPKNDGERYERSVLNNPDSGTFVIEVLGPHSAFHIDEVYLCGFSHDNSIFETLKLFSEFMQTNTLHIIDDLIYCDDKNEKNAIDIYCLDNNINQNNFTRFN